LNPVHLIARKRDGGALAEGEIRDFVEAYVDGSVADHQMSALAMAILLRGMTTDETAALTAAMLESGERLDRADGGPRVDKHSTGGIGDKVSLVLAPLLACLGARVPMISGRGLGPTGGTLDKLESIPGFRTDLSRAEIAEVVDSGGCVITGATAEIAPADRKLYALRDVTGTVPSVPLITASILAKKLAEGLDALVLDVKFGGGAFMKTADDARELARSLVETATRMGVPTTALVTNMHEPLGRMMGNAVEVAESLDVLEGGGPADVRELTLELAAEVLVTAGLATDRAAALAAAAACLDDGRALERFERMVAAQGGDLGAKRPVAAATEIAAERGGIVTAIDAEALGWAVIDLGGGRRSLGAAIDHAVGLEMLVRVGEEVERGEPLVRVLARDADGIDGVIARVRDAVVIGDERPVTVPLVAERIAAETSP
jgi:pyrimidine-nucleoside phosphorylase